MKNIFGDSLKLTKSNIMPFSMKRKPKETLEETLQDTIEAKTIDEYKLGSKDSIFVHRLVSNSKLSRAEVQEIPPVVDAFQYIKTLESDLQPPWFFQAQKTLVENNKDYPEIVSISRAYIAPFLVEHSKHDNNSFPCISPANECTSERLGGFRCRALLFPNQLATNDTIGYCYLCHLFRTNSLYIETRDNSLNTTDGEVYRIHDFIVHVNVVGEYKLEYMLPGPINGKNGLFGPFPAFNQNNYKAITRSDDLKQWVENESMVFRLPQVALDQI